MPETIPAQLELMPRLSLAVYEAEYIEAEGQVAYPVSGDTIRQLTWWCKR